MSGTPRIAYQPALDGVRALAVAVVLLFHGGVPGFGAGYLGVSVFFTLSGFLITMLLLEEHRADGRIDLGAFYARRLRRLLPASLVTIGVLAALAATSDLFAGVTAMRRQVIGSLLQVVNWVVLADEGSYQERLAGASGSLSPLEHFWSLAIEEQFYWIWPVTVLGVLTIVTSQRGRIAAIGAITIVSMGAAPLVAVVWGGEAAYWATPARLSEILIGALLAVVVIGRTVDVRWHAAAVGGLIALGVFVGIFPASDRVASAGVLPIVGVVSGLLILGLQAPGPATRALSIAPLVWLGRISYGVYLYHWPVYVIVDEPRLGVGGAGLLVVRIVLTLAIAQLSFVVLEQPVRRARPQLVRPTFGLAAALTTVAVVGAALIVPASDSDYWQVDAGTVEAAAIEVDDVALAPTDAAAGSPGSTTEPDTSDPMSTPAPTAPDAMPPGSTSTSAPSPIPTSPIPTSPVTASTTPNPTAVGAAPTTSIATTASTASTTLVTTTLPPIPELNRPVRVLVTGDSTAEALGAGVVRWAAAHPQLAQAEIVAAPGCGFLTGGERKQGDALESSASCDPWVDDFLLPAIERTRPDVLVVMVTSWDLIDRRWDSGDLAHPTDPEFRRRLRAAYGDLVADAASLGANRVALVEPPVPNPFWLDRDDPVDTARRHAVLHDTFGGVADDHPGVVQIVGLSEWFASSGSDTDREVRPDGVHLTPESAEQVTDAWLGDELLRVALDLPR